MTEDRYLELAPLAALGVLDGEDRSGFFAHVPGCMVCRAELTAHESVAALIPLALVPVRASRSLRDRLIAGDEPLPRAVARPRLLPAGLAVAAAVALGLGLLVVRTQRDAAITQAAEARAAAAVAKAQARETAEALVSARRDLGEAAALRALFEGKDARVATLIGLPPAATARARIVFDPSTREAVLVATGLEQAPEGKAYAAWVIASGVPVPAGVFRPDGDGRAMLRLPVVSQTAQVKTFAVTLEPEAGSPAPTGPMLLAGAVS